MAQLLARAGETVHVIAHRWPGASQQYEELEGGRLCIHRVALGHPRADRYALSQAGDEAGIASGLLESDFPAQAFSWQAALLAEHLVETASIDVIEAQEWEAPLYFLQLRRSLGIGPARRPPIVIHLHSPTERIYAANGWDTDVVDYAECIRQEEFSIRAADALIAPSRYLADQVAERYGIDANAIQLIRYPLGDTPSSVLPIAQQASRAIAQIGRLEPRKGVLELAEALSLLTEHPDLIIELIGSDTPLAVTGGRTVADAIRQRFPPSVVDRLRFHGSCDRAQMHALLARCCAVVVPSRWENFPYSCIEAMAAGLPVIVSPAGGMKEIIEDGLNGWIVADTTPAALAHTLQRALDTAPDERAAMGRRAAATIAQSCANATVLAEHLGLKMQLASAPDGAFLAARVGAGSGVAVPAFLASACLPADAAHQRREKRYSVMAMALRRAEMPLLRWLRGSSDAERRAAVQSVVRNPLGLAGWLWQRARAVTRRPVAVRGESLRSEPPAP